MSQFIIKTSDSNLKAETAKLLNIAETDEIISKFEWLGLFSNDEIIPSTINNALDAVCYLWEKKLQYEEGEKDMIVMKHTFEVEYPHTNKPRESITSTLIDYGQQPTGYSSMARTVSLPVAIIARAILDGRVKDTGLVRPVQPHIYNLILKEMEELGVTFVEEVQKPHLWIRNETKPGEERVIIVPRDAQKLIQAGYRVSVESSSNAVNVRCIADEEYVKVGCELVRSNSWSTDAPLSAIILGLKELPESNHALFHRHIYFAHCYKNQQGWEQLLQRFTRGNSLLWDLEFLTDDNGRRVAAFGRSAGIVGMALALLQWSNQHTKSVLPSPLNSWKSMDELIQTVTQALENAKKVSGLSPSVIILGSLGRCGNGASWFAKQCGIESSGISEWDLNETKAGGPFIEILQHNILVNCIYLAQEIPPFLTHDFIQANNKTRKLSVISDVSCDPTNPYNPLPLYKEGTTIYNPFHTIVAEQLSDGILPLELIAIDHLPSLLPYDSSDLYSADLLPSLLHLKESDTNGVWVRAQELFNQKSKLAAASSAMVHPN